MGGKPKPDVAETVHPERGIHGNVYREKYGLFDIEIPEFDYRFGPHLNGTSISDRVKNVLEYAAGLTHEDYPKFVSENTLTPWPEWISQRRGLLDPHTGAGMFFHLLGELTGRLNVDSADPSYVECVLKFHAKIFRLCDAFFRLEMERSGAHTQLISDRNQANKRKAAGEVDKKKRQKREHIVEREISKNYKCIPRGKNPTVKMIARAIKMGVNEQFAREDLFGSSSKAKGELSPRELDDLIRDVKKKWSPKQRKSRKS